MIPPVGSAKVRSTFLTWTSTPASLRCRTQPLRSIRSTMWAEGTSPPLDSQRFSATRARYFLAYSPSQTCWFVDLGLVDKVNPHEFEFRFLFTLVGLSSSGRAAF